MPIRWMKTSPATFQGFWLTLSLVTCLFLLQIQPISNRNFTLGLLIPFSECSAVGNWYHCGNWYASAITVALRKINSDPKLLAGHHLNFIWNDTRCKEHVAVKQQIYQLNAGVDVFIGPACHCKTAAINAAAFNKTIISYGCSSAMVENKRLAPTFIRSMGIDENLIPAIARLLTTFKWKHIAIIFEKIAKYIKIKDLLVSELERDGFPTPHIVGIEQYESLSDDSFVVKTFSDIKEHAKILVFVTEISISRPVVYYLRRSGLVYKDTVFIICQVDPVFVSSYLKNPVFLFLDYHLEAHGKMSDNKTRLLKKYLDSVLMIGVRPPTGREYHTFKEQVKADISKPPFSSQIYNRSFIPQPPFLAANLYDAVMLYALALNKTLAVGQNLTGVNLANKLKGTNFKSIQGFDMRVNQNGSALNNWTLYQIRDVENNNSWFAPVGRFLVEPMENNSFHSKIALKLDPLKEITWANGRKGMNGIPKDMPKCGFKGELCKTKPAKDDQRIYIIAGVTILVILVIVILLGTIIRQCKLERELKSTLWKIRYSDLQLPQRRGSVQSHCSHSMVAKDLDSEYCFNGDKQTSVCQYKGNWVTVSKLASCSISLTRKVNMELKQMRDIRHKNLNPFIGACTDAPHVCIVLHYCSRGSLQDVLENHDVTIDHLFVASLVVDIIKGMIFLHNSEIKSHGNLKSSNCLIDSQWVLKITDYGLPTFRSKALRNSNSTDMFFEESLWDAPEILRMFPRSPEGTQKGDVYSFAIILQEFHTRNGPYSANYDIEAKEIIERVREGEMPPYRPIVPTLLTGIVELYDLMKHCWNEEPEQRPDFHEIKKTVLKALANNGIKTNIVDNMVYMMEKYADNLEEVVHERTEQLIEEKKKTEALLDRMLPRPVAEQLKKGRAVEAESFREVSIYFSDIVGFTSLSADSTPMQVVMMLNDLYSIFDNIIRGYDVYKVETIGDAYMVVSGLPIRNGHKHASEISRMALHLVDAVKKDFVVQHKPGYKLKLRVGIHSGPVVAGVVGNIMPRYCLFGDTVNTASRMESTGEALRVHISSQTKQILDKMEGFQIEERGEIEIKGKGKVVTYWLIKAKMDLDSGVRVPHKLNGYITPSPKFKRRGSRKWELKFKSSPTFRNKQIFTDDDRYSLKGSQDVYFHNCNGSSPQTQRLLKNEDEYEMLQV